MDSGVIEAAWRGAREPLLCLEVNPPRGSDIEEILVRLGGGCLEGVDFLNVTDSALARMKMAAIPFAALLQNRLKRVALVNMSCRDRNLIALQGDLLAGWALGIKSVIALTGDAMTIGDSPERKGVFEINSIGLLGAIKALNSGLDVDGHKLSSAPALTAGVVVNPNARNSNAEIRRLQRKKDAGAQYALSQPVFDLHQAGEFLAAARVVDLPIFLGLMPLKNAKAAAAMQEIPGMRLSADLTSRLVSNPDGDWGAYTIEHCCRIASALRSQVAGLHVISGASAKLALELTGSLAKVIKGGK